MKKRKFASGGYQEGPNKNIDDDTRARAMRFVNDPLSQVIKDAEDRDRARQTSKSAPTTPSPTTPALETEKPRKPAPTTPALEAEESPKRSMQNVMGVRAAKQMEEKGSIYSKDFGKPKAEREAEAASRKTTKAYEGAVADEDASTGRSMMRFRADENKRKAGESAAVEREAKQDMRDRQMPKLKTVPRAFSNKISSSSRAQELADRKANKSSGTPYSGRFKSGGSVSSASKRADGIAKRGLTKFKVY